MSEEVASKIVHYTEATENEGYIECDIVGVGTYGQFSTGWIDHDFMYERPNIVLDIQSEIGYFQVDIDVENIENTILSDLLDDFEPDIRDLIGERVQVYPNEDFSRGTLSLNKDEKFESEDSHSLITESENYLDVISCELDSNQDLAGDQRMPIERMNNILKMEKERLIRGINGWMEIELSCSKKSQRIEFKSVRDDLEVTWSFDNTTGEYEKVKSFVDKLNVHHTLEGRSENVWIKPVRSIHRTNRPEKDIFISDMETWIVSEQPMNPEEDTSILSNIIDALSISSTSVDTCVGQQRTSKADIAEKYGDYLDNCYCSTETFCSDQKDDVLSFN